MSKEPEFKVGDAVEFEVMLDGAPRWNGRTDYTQEGERSAGWLRGEVIMTGATELRVEHIDQYGIKRGWLWPLVGSRRYSPDQWQRPGYLRHAVTPQSVEPAGRMVTIPIRLRLPGTPRCVCGAHSTSNTNLHSTWCDLYE